MSHSNKQRKLFDLDVRKVSFVGNPANGYDFLFFKSEGKSMSELKEAIQEKTEELKKSEDVEDQISKALQNLSKYYGDLPKEARESLAVVGSAVSKSFKKEDEDMDKESLKEVIKEALSEEGILEKSNKTIEEAVGMLSEELDMSKSEVMEVLGPVLNKEETSEEKSEEPEDVKSEFKVSELTDDQISKVKEEHNLYTEEEVEEVVSEEMDAIFEGETE